MKHGLETKVDELEQYGRRVCLGIEVLNTNLTRNLRKFWINMIVINIIKKSEADIPDSVFDRAHQISPTYIQMIRDKKSKT